MQTGFALKGWRRVAFLLYGVGGIVVIGAFLILLWLALTTQSARIRTGDIVTLILSAALVGWLGYELLSPFWRLIDLRIIMAPDLLLSFRDQHVQLEAAKNRRTTASTSASYGWCGTRLPAQDAERRSICTTVDESSPGALWESAMNILPNMCTRSTDSPRQASRYDRRSLTTPPRDRFLAQIAATRRLMFNVKECSVDGLERIGTQRSWPSRSAATGRLKHGLNLDANRHHRRKPSGQRRHESERREAVAFSAVR